MNQEGIPDFRSRDESDPFGVDESSSEEEGGIYSIIQANTVGAS